MREDYSAGGSAWDDFPHDQARSLAYRWGEDGMAGVSDVGQEQQSRRLGDTITGIMLSLLLIGIVLWPWQYEVTAGAGSVPVLAARRAPVT